LTITIPAGQDPLNCTATVVRIVRELPDDSGYEYGVQFDPETIHDPSHIEKLVRSIDIVPLLERMLKEDATDLHISAGSPPVYRIRRRLTPERNPLSRDLVEALVLGLLSAERRETLERQREVYFSFTVPGLGRWRVAAFYQRGNLEATFHTVLTEAPSLMELGLPDIISNIAQMGAGLVAVTGASGCGKSTTIAAMIQAINQEKDRIIVTLEDPIECIHQNQRSLIKQREVGTDVSSVREGMENVLRQDPDVIVVDKILDTDVMDLALHAAENGRLVIATFPTSDGVATIRRILAMYGEKRQHTARHALANTLQAVISQRLLPSADASEMVLVPEVLILNDSIRQTIRTNNLDQIQNLMTSAPGSIFVDAALRRLLTEGKLSLERACLMARDPDALKRNVTG
jgi:twitching motility protein PilT